ncbi:type II secretion system protein [Desulfoluna sp.]|uniref:type II secretion system protein n=1 Tax=Desulfoluna sp. TaxID=2045199 RepID=UPI00261FE237|nr:type II secretion system protein [Desulfoluna sp.]
MKTQTHDMQKEQKNPKKSQDGFTLLEILVVLTIMGFLIAMVAPRLAGISGGAVDTVCDSNQNRMVTYMSSFFEQTNRFPNKLTNLVIEDGIIAAGTAGKYQIPMTSDQDPENGAEVLAAEFYERNHFHIHVLNDDEAKELKKMGIVKVFNLNDYSGQNDAGDDFTGDETTNDIANDLVLAADRKPVMESVTVKEDLGVAMVGCGIADANFVATNKTERGWGEPEFIGRIVLGMGPECSLITSGIIGNAAHCPGGIQNTDNCTYNDYSLVLPRLEATAARMSDATIGAVFIPMDGDTDESGIQISCLSYDDAPTSGYDYVGNTENFRYRQFTIDEAQEAWQFATQCPEGHMYPEDDGEFWGIDFAPTTPAHGGPSAGSIDG